MWHRLLITPPLMAWQRHSTKRSSSYSKSSSPRISEIGTKSLVNVFGPTGPRFEHRQAIRLFSLVYGCEAVIPLEIQMPSLRVALMTKITLEDNDRLRLQELEALDEKRLQAQQHIKLYQARISKAFNKKVCLLYTSPSPRDRQKSRMPSSA